MKFDGILINGLGRHAVSDAIGWAIAENSSGRPQGPAAEAIVALGAYSLMHLATKWPVSLRTSR